MTDKEMDAELERLRAERSKHSRAMAVLAGEIETLKRKRWRHRCCRSWPDDINGLGLCAACGYDHKAGKKRVPR